MKTWKFGIIGCGGIANFHIKAIGEIENAELVCVSSRNPEKARAVGEQEHVDWVTDYRELLARPDVEIVCVTTSSGSHGTIGAEVLNAGKHLIMEKPIAMTVKDAERLVERADKKGRRLGVISNRRFEPCFQLAKKAVSEGYLGNLLLVEVHTPFLRTQEYYDSADWRGTIAEDGGVLMNQGIHQIDLMNWLGGPVRTVYGKTATQTHRMEAEDMGVAIVTFENGAMGTIMASTSIQPGFPASVKVYGEKGTINIEGDAITHWLVPGLENNVGHKQVLASGSKAPLSISHENHKRQISEFINALAEGRTPLVSGKDGLDALKLIDAIYRSSESAAEIKLT